MSPPLPNPPLEGRESIFNVIERLLDERNR